MNRLSTRSSWIAFWSMLLAAGTVVVPTAAQAARPYEQFVWHEEADFVTERCGVEVRIQVSEGGKGIARATGRDQLPRYTVSWSGDATWTNVETGLTFSFDWTLREQEVKAVDNGDGTTTVLYQLAGPEHVYGPDGERLYLWVGLARSSDLINNGGTPANPFDDSFIGGDFLSFSGRPDTGGDFCTTFRELTGANP